MNGLPFFKYKNIVSLDEQLYITKKNVYKGAARDLIFTPVPGRNGDLIIDNKRYKNISITYDVCALEGINHISEIAHRVKGWLLSDVGYFKLSDSYDSKYFRFAAYSDEYDLEQELPSLGYSKITFICKPFRFSNEGQKVITLSAATSIRNPEFFPSFPYIKITGDGDITLIINGLEYIFKDVNGYIEIDSEKMQAYRGTVSENTKMYTSTFPKLVKGVNDIDWSGAVSQVEIIPRWCCL